jgi:hypothetical protein
MGVKNNLSHADETGDAYDVDAKIPGFCAAGQPLKPTHEN